MTHEKKQLSELFQSVENDTPALGRDELRNLLEQKDSGNLPMGPLQTAIITEDRRRGFIKKGTIIMTLIAISIIAFLLSQPSSDVATSKVTIATPNLSSNLQSKNVTDEKPSQTFLTKENKKTTTAFTSPDIQPIKPVEVNDAALKKLGIIRKENGDILCYQKLESKKVIFEMSFHAHARDIVAAIRAKSSCELGDNAPSFAPVYVTGINGTMSGKMSASGPSATQAKVFDQLTDEEIERVDEISRNAGPNTKLNPSDMVLIQKLQTLLGKDTAATKEQTYLPDGIDPIPTLCPVLVRKNSFVNGKESNDGLIFWYGPTKEFLKVGTEIKILTKYTIPENADSVVFDPNGKHEVWTKEQLLAIRQNSSNVISKCLVYPNPAISKTTIRFSLSVSRTLAFSIHDLLGKRVLDGGSLSENAGGSFEKEFDLSELPAGVYLLVITTDKGEQNIQRLVINK